MTAVGLLIIGDEILEGHVEDRHLSWLATRLREGGHRLIEATIVSDHRSDIARHVQRLIEDPACDVVVTTGGVGPTPDDLTYEAVATALDRDCCFDERILTWVAEWCPDAAGPTDRRLMERMASTPRGSWLLAPERLGGPAVAVAADGGTLIAMLPGSSSLLQRVWTEAVEAELLQAGPGRSCVEIQHALPEALLAPVFDLADPERGLQVGSYPGAPNVVRLSGPPAVLAEIAPRARALLESDDPAPTAFPSVDEAIRTLAGGGMVVVVDDEDRENEADLIVGAENVTAEQLAFIVRHTSGIVCAPMPPDRADALELSPMVLDSSDPHGTAFTTTVDHVSTSTGVSATDRARTLRALADPTARPAEFQRPGHVFPLRARPGGVLKRAGHTEAAVDLLTLAGRKPVGVIGELVATDGEMLAGDGVRCFARTHSLPIVAIADLIRYRRQREDLVELAGRAELPTAHGIFEGHAFRAADGSEHLALVHGRLRDEIPPLVRVHSECLTGDGLASLRCDCGPQLDAALRMIVEEGAGVLVYLRGHEGRGIGLGHKLRAYGLQDRGHDTVDANLALGLPVDDRDYGVGASILTQLGVRRIRLITNNPHKYTGLSGHGIDVVERVVVAPRVTPENHAYLLAKRDRLGHELDVDDRPPAARQ